MIPLFDTTMVVYLPNTDEDDGRYTVVVATGVACRLIEFDVTPPRAQTMRSEMVGGMTVVYDAAADKLDIRSQLEIRGVRWNVEVNRPDFRGPNGVIAYRAADVVEVIEI